MDFFFSLSTPQNLRWSVILCTAGGAHCGQQRTDRPGNVCSPRHAHTAHSLGQQEQGDNRDYWAETQQSLHSKDRTFRSVDLFQLLQNLACVTQLNKKRGCERWTVVQHFLLPYWLRLLVIFDSFTILCFSVMGMLIWSVYCYIVNMNKVNNTTGDVLFSIQLQWKLSMEDTFGTQLAVLYTVVPLYSGHHWDPASCPVYSGTSL